MRMWVMRRLRIGWALLLIGIGFSTPSVFSNASVHPPVPSCDLSRSAVPDSFCARSNAVLNLLIVRYGAPLPETSLQTIATTLQIRFHAATRGKLSLRVARILQLPLKSMNRDLSQIRARIGGTDPNTRTPERLERLWSHYQGPNYSLPDEIRNEMIARGYSDALTDADFVAALSAAQFEDLSYQSGGFILSEYPREIAWGLANGGWTHIPSSEQVVDEWIHEIGHGLGLDHASYACSRIEVRLDPPHANEADLRAIQACCAASPARNDVMSYCRNREKVFTQHAHAFTDCTLGFLESTAIPLLLAGGARPRDLFECP